MAGTVLNLMSHKEVASPRRRSAVKAPPEKFLARSAGFPHIRSRATLPGGANAVRLAVSSRHRRRRRVCKQALFLMLYEENRFENERR